MDIDELHQSRKLPTRYYNQLNKTPQKNYKNFKIGKKRNNESIIQAMMKQFLYQTLKELLKELLPKEIKL